MWITIALAVSVGGLAGILVQKFRSRPPVRLVHRCPACTQQIRYQASQIGSEGHCPRCWKRVILPREPQTSLPPGKALPRSGPRVGRLQDNPNYVRAR